MTSISKVVKTKAELTDDEIIKSLNERKAISDKNFFTSPDSIRKDMSMGCEDCTEKKKQFLLQEFKDIFQGSLEMFKFRNNGYDYEKFLSSVKSMNLEQFHNTITDTTQYNNPLRDQIDRIFTLNKSVFKNISDYDLFYFEMSYLIKNPSGEKTAVFFIPKFVSTTQIPISVIRILMGVLFVLIAKNIKINEIVIIHTGEFQNEGKKLFSTIRGTFFIQFFTDIDILNPVVTSIRAPKYVVLGKEKTDIFLRENPNLSVDKLKREYSENPVLKYYGIKPKTLVLILRPIFLSGNMGTDSTFAYVV